MPRAPQDLEMVALRIYREDLARCARFYPGQPKTAIFREIIKKYFDGLDKKLDRKSQLQLPEPD